MNTKYNLSQINPKSILRSEILRLDAGKEPYPVKPTDDWWVLWAGDEPVAYLVCRTWQLNPGYGVVHYCGDLSTERWKHTIQSLVEYAEGQGYYNLFLITGLLSEIPNVTLEYKNRHVREFPLTPQIKDEEQETENASVPVHMPELPVYL